MLMESQTVRVESIENGFIEVIFDRDNDVINKLDQATMREVKDAIACINTQDNVKGVLFSSTKDSFIVGADITEFTQMFTAGEKEIHTHLLSLNEIFNDIEDLPCPTVSVINGVSLGGGFELCLATDYRVATENAKVGLPEVKLGIHPGWGGTVRLPRVIGLDNANEWICGGIEKRANDALKEGAVDAVVASDRLREAGLDLLLKCVDGELDYQARRKEKQSPVHHNQTELMMAFESAKGVVAGKAGPHYPAPLQVLKTMQKSVELKRDKAIEMEVASFVKLAKNDATASLVNLFLNDQQVKRVAKKYSKESSAVKQAAVIGAGIMGGGIAYQSASCGVPILMKDLNNEALQLGLDEATRLLMGQIKRGRSDARKMAQILNRIVPVLSDGEFYRADMVVEAVVENANVKKAVLESIEEAVPEDTVLTSNTSTISINELATALQRPENFCGMHFFNPVHRMPLVEIIRGEKTSEATIARTVNYAQAMGKTPIVVNDCPGFLVNRVLFPYFGGFSAMVSEGADFQLIDKVMERFGWPMGPAYLLDVVGVDTAHHADAVMAAAFPERMAHEAENAIDRLYALERFGQKNQKGFYRYETDKRGKQKKLVDETVPELLADIVYSQSEFDEQTIIERMMIPLCIEVVRCLEEGIVASPAEADMALIYGIGFPPFRGGVCYYLDQMGLDKFCQMTEKYHYLGDLYQPTEKMLAMAVSGQAYYQNADQEK